MLKPIKQSGLLVSIVTAFVLTSQISYAAE